jgi:hypothetical protein
MHASNHASHRCGIFNFDGMSDSTQSQSGHTSLVCLQPTYAALDLSHSYFARYWTIHRLYSNYPAYPLYAHYLPGPIISIRYQTPLRANFLDTQAALRGDRIG